MDRLLTIEEIAEKTAGHTESESLLIVRNLQDGKTHRETLRAVGEWMTNRLRVHTADYGAHYEITTRDVEALKRGEMPDDTHNN